MVCVIVGKFDCFVFYIVVFFWGIIKIVVFVVVLLD